MDQARIDLAAGEREVAYRQSVHLIGRLRLLFGDIHLVIGGAVEDRLRVEMRQRPLDSGGIGDVGMCAVPCGHFIIARFQLTYELYA